MNAQDREYLLRREATQRRLARSATDADIRKIHQTMADEYRRKIDDASRVQAQSPS